MPTIEIKFISVIDLPIGILSYKTVPKTIINPHTNETFEIIESPDTVMIPDYILKSFCWN